ncbi:MAG: hypothetical protein V7607_1729 [Solirubrobacteraceae bacterium]
MQNRMSSALIVSLAVAGLAMTAAQAMAKPPVSDDVAPKSGATVQIQPLAYTYHGTRRAVGFATVRTERTQRGRWRVTGAVTVSDPIPRDGCARAMINVYSPEGQIFGRLFDACAPVTATAARPFTMPYSFESQETRTSQAPTYVQFGLGRGLGNGPTLGRMTVVRRAFS